MQLTRKRRDRMQVTAFHAIFKVLRNDGDYTLEEAFANAITLTCDEVFDRMQSSPLMEEWYRKYGEPKNQETDSSPLQQ